MIVCNFCEENRAKGDRMRLVSLGSGSGCLRKSVWDGG
jgi:hypothetical protein